MALEKFLYFDKKPTNVCWNGTSFPLLPKDIIKCLPGFIEAFIDKKWYKKVAADDPRPVKYIFPATPFFLTPDPMKGLPVRSDPNIGPHLRGKHPRPVEVLGEERNSNPYDLGVEKAVVDEEPKVVITTTATAPAPAPAPETGTEDEKEEKVEDFDIGEEEVETTIELDLPDPPDPPDEDDVQIDLPEVDQGPEIPLKAVLRVENRNAIYARMVGIREMGCPLNPEMMDSFNEFKPKTTRGIMFKALWQYYGFDG